MLPGRGTTPPTPTVNPAQWAAIFASINDAVCLLDTDGNTVICNRAMTEITGTRACICKSGSYLSSIYASTPSSRSPFATVKKTLKRVTYVHAMNNRSYGVRIDPFFNHEGKFSGTIHIMSDITDRVQANEKLGRVAGNLQAIIKSAPVAIITRNLNGLVTTWSPAAERIFGWTADDVIGKDSPTKPAGSMEQTEESQALHRKVLHGRTFRSIEARRPHKDGHLVDISFSLAPLRDPGGRITGSVSVVIDITDLKHTEEVLQLRESEVRQLLKMEAIGRLAGGMAHDFNNILTAIMGYSELLIDSIPAGDERRGQAESILNASERAASLCRHLLTFSRRQIMKTEVFHLNDTLEEARAMLPPLLSEDVTLIVESAPDLWPVKANESQIQQMIVNMATNAREAMPQGGTIIIETSNTELDAEYTKRHPGTEPGDYVMVAVSDTGTGISNEVKSHLFEPFYTTKKDGSGLGLSTIYGMIRQIGGHIDVYSEAGTGTTFKVYIPRSRETITDRKDDGPTVPPTSLRGTESILVVEDRAILRELITEILSLRGYSVTTVSNAAEALRIVENNPEDNELVLTDLVMPGMNGGELAQRILRIRPTQKILFMSGYTATVLSQQKLLDKKIAFLQKPFTPDTLSRKIREVLDPPAEQ